MGNNIAGNSQQSFLDGLGDKYQQLKRQSRGAILQDKQTQMTYLLKQFVYPTESTFKNKLKIIQQQIKLGPRQFIINPIKVQHKIYNNFCSTSYKIIVVYQYPQVTLREEIIARKKQNKNFEETQLWSILQSCTNALGQLRPFVSLNPNEIFINPDGNLKIIHDDLVQQNYRAIITNNIYYAPQKLKNFNRIDTQLTMRKQAIFSMGMTILQAAQLQQISSCYDYNQCSFNTTSLQFMLSNLQEKYSTQFIDILNNILQVNPNRRASLMQIQKNLDIYWNTQKNQQQQTNTRKSNQTYENQQQTNQNQQIHKQKEYPLNNNNSNYSKPYAIETHKQLTFNNSKKLLAYDPNTIETPKNFTSNTTKQNNGSLYTDPKLFQMIRKDLQEINKLKQSTLYEPSRYTFMYPQTQNILNSIKNMNRESNTSNKIYEFNDYNHSQRISFEQDHKMMQKNKEIKSNYGQQFKMKQPRKSQVYTNGIQNVQQSNYMSNNMKKQSKQHLVFIIQTYENGSRYEGTTLNGKKHGYGKLIFEDGVYYEGEFKQDKMNGKGILYYSKNQIAYDGQWSNDQFNGYGILYNQNPAPLNQMYDYRDFNNIEDYWVKYQGNFVYDNKSGQGKLFLTNGEILQGQFKEDYVDGHCRFMRMNGELIQGFWQTNMLGQETNQLF